MAIEYKAPERPIKPDSQLVTMRVGDVGAMEAFVPSRWMDLYGALDADRRYFRGLPDAVAVEVQGQRVSLSWGEFEALIAAMQSFRSALTAYVEPTSTGLHYDPSTASWRQHPDYPAER